VRAGQGQGLMGYARLYLFARSTAAVEMADAIAVLNWARVESSRSRYFGGGRRWSPLLLLLLLHNEQKVKRDNKLTHTITHAQLKNAREADYTRTHA